MLTSDKAICEMNTGELAEEYEYCMKSAESEALAPDLQRYFRCYKNTLTYEEN